MHASDEPTVETPGTPTAWSVPQMGQHSHAARLQLGGPWEFVLVDHVLVDCLGHQGLGLCLHPGGPEGRAVLARITVQEQLIVDELLGSGRKHPPTWETVARHRSLLDVLGEHRVESEIVGQAGGPSVRTHESSGGDCGMSAGRLARYHRACFRSGAVR